jgi:hypothetical protein
MQAVHIVTTIRKRHVTQQTQCVFAPSVGRLAANMKKYSYQWQSTFAYISHAAPYLKAAAIFKLLTRYE